MRNLTDVWCWLSQMEGLPPEQLASLLQQRHILRAKEILRGEVQSKVQSRVQRGSGAAGAAVAPARHQRVA